VKRRATQSIESQFAAVVVLRVRAAIYESAAQTRRTLGWRAPTTSPNFAVELLTTLRDRSRDAVRKDGYAKGVIDKLVYNSVGTGLVPMPLSVNKQFKKLALKFWKEWTDYSDADGTLEWYGQQSEAVRCWLEAGEVFLRLRSRRPEDGIRVPLQVQVLEPEMCPHTYNGTAPNGGRIRAGIEFDAIGRRVAYYFFASRPGDLNDWNQGDLRRVPAESVLHVYKPVRAGQVRGIPHLTQALVKLRELDKFDDATVLRQQLTAMFVAFLKKAASTDAAIVPILGRPTESAQGDTRPALRLQPGIFQELAPGEEIQFSNPPDVMAGYQDFIKQQLRGVSAATGVPYEILTGDMSGLNDRTMRVVLHEFRRQIMAEQHQTLAFQLCRPVWRAWMDRAVLLTDVFAGVVTPAEYLADPEPWQAVKWMPQGWPYMHPVQDRQAAKDAVRSGFMSRTDVVAEQGEDAEAVDLQQAADNERADELGLVYDSDPRYTSSAGLTQARPTGSVIPGQEEAADAAAAVPEKEDEDEDDGGAEPAAFPPPAGRY